MGHVKVANFQFLHGAFTLPGIRTTPGKATHIRGDEVIYFDLPDDVTGDGLLSFIFNPAKGADDGISVTFEVRLGGSKYGWSFNTWLFACLQLPVGGLKKGQNYLIFETTKAGRVTAPDPDESLGGKGVVHFDSVSLTYHRNVAI
ncbi:MAG: hypothetical protein ABUT39_08965 [Acidobacteriota bacterium]